ncbi:unnamed protein product, partial [Heterotrigona itama]
IRKGTHVILGIGDVVSQLQFIELQRLLHPVRTGRRTIRMQ